MNTLTKDKILAALPTLPRGDLAAIRGAADHLLGEAAVTPGHDMGPLYAALTGVLGVNLAYNQFAATSAFRQWKKYASVVISFVNETFPKQLESQIATQAMMKYAILLIVDDLKQRNVNVTLGAVVTNLGRVPELFRAAFPDYIENGLAHLIPQAMKSAKDRH